MSRARSFTSCWRVSSTRTISADSATAHYAVVERAWRSADPFLKPRYEAARQRLAR